jgi:hypothetical protein
VLGANSIDRGVTLLHRYIINHVDSDVCVKGIYFRFIGMIAQVFPLGHSPSSRSIEQLGTSCLHRNRYKQAA